mmetsp:Transcript_34976/g.53689  ORF Transcript_34976/g.53689 Transcript_34976/m.53689 type:complete len:94 (-) Transcript_34976:1329-1610(-)
MEERLEVQMESLPNIASEFNIPSQGTFTATENGDCNNNSTSKKKARGSIPRVEMPINLNWDKSTSMIKSFFLNKRKSGSGSKERSSKRTVLPR